MGTHIRRRRGGYWVAIPLLLAVIGCGKSEETATNSVSSARAPSTASPARAPARTAEQPPQRAPAAEVDAQPSPPAAKKAWRTSLSDLLEEAEAENQGQRGVAFNPAPFPEIDENRLAVAGIRKLEGKHLVLYTDLPPQPAIDELPQVFDLAVPQWCAYFGLEPGKVAQWQLHGYLIDRKEPFLATGLLPADLPSFLHGFHRGLEVWLYEQPSDYYRRHLLLHEGTHGFMKSVVGGGGPPWYLEGMAELLGTHRWRDGKLQVAYFPQSKEDVPMWGRIKIVQDEFAASRGMTLPQIFEMGPQAHLKVEPYGWSWAAAAFLDGHPRTQAAFRNLRAHVRQIEPDFSAHLRLELGADWPKAVEEWQLFVSRADYGYDLPREAVDFLPGTPLESAGRSVTLAADRGWQSSGVMLEAGKTYRITASGQFVVARGTEPWACEANGITLRYHRGLPLGVLLGAVRPEEFSEGQVSALLNPGVLGTERTIRAPAKGVLYLRINDAQLSDNAGTLQVQVAPEP